jgi:hypothetical protein
MTEQETVALLLDVRELWKRCGAGLLRSVSIPVRNLCKVFPRLLQLYVEVGIFSRVYLFIIPKSDSVNYIAERRL